MDPGLGSTLFTCMQNRFEKFARIFSRRHKQRTFSDAGFLGILRVKVISKAVAPGVVLLFVALWFILRGELFYVLPCVILFL